MNLHTCRMSVSGVSGRHVCLLVLALAAFDGYVGRYVGQNILSFVFKDEDFKAASKDQRSKGNGTAMGGVKV